MDFEKQEEGSLKGSGGGDEDGGPPSPPKQVFMEALKETSGNQSEYIL